MFFRNIFKKKVFPENEEIFINVCNLVDYLFYLENFQENCWKIKKKSNFKEFFFREMKRDEDKKTKNLVNF